MKRIIKSLFILAIMFVLPNVVLADDVDTKFDYFDINKIVSLKYKVMNTEYSIPNIDESLSGIKLYVLDKDDKNIRTEISFNANDISLVEDNYRISGSFDKYYADTDIYVDYLVEYTYVADVDSTDKNVVYSKIYNFVSENNVSDDEGILVKLEDTSFVKIFAPRLILNKSLEIGTPDGTFNFTINDENVSITTVGASESVGGSGSKTIYLNFNTTYVVKEINILNTYELVSIDSVRDTDDADDTVTVVTTDSLDDVVVVNVLNKNKVDHSKNLIDNEDGTYKLSLDVIGENEKLPAKKANVVIIFDTSGSMSNNTGTGRTIYVYNSTNDNSWTTQFYGLVNGEYVALTRRSDGNYYYGRSGNWTRYRGQRYTRKSVNETRLIAGQEAIKSLAGGLLSNNILDDDDTSNDDIVKMALVTFGQTAKTAVSPTNLYSNIETAVNNAKASGGTNWEDALQEAMTINFGANRDAITYYVFVSDGNPTYRNTKGTYGNLPRYDNPNWNDYYWDMYKGDQKSGNKEYGLGNDRAYNANGGAVYNYSPTSMQRCYDHAKDEARTVVSNGVVLYTVGAYGDAARMENLANYAYTGSDNTSPEGTYYYDAADTEQLKQALKEILAAIERSGIGAVTINDGTTQSVTTSTGVSNLLTVDTNSFEYWLTFPVNDNNEIMVNDTDVTVSKNSDNTYRLTWIEGETSKYVDISSDSYFDTTANTFVYRWTGANQLYNVAPPQAKLENGSVNWILSKDNVGLLLNNVKYSVTFDVWPSQYTYDLISDLDNGIKKYDDLDENIKMYLVGKDGSYSLQTNTIATLKYDDSRDDDGERTTSFVNPEPIATGVSQVSIKKFWENDLDDHSASSVELYLTRDGARYGEVNASGKVVPYVLNDDDNWEQLLYIATGLISLDEVNKSAIIREIGHDYSFEEDASYSYYWDLVVDVRRPMMVNGNLTMLVKTNEVDVSEIGSKNYLEKNNNKYYRICDKNGNNCSSYKVITGNNAGFISAVNYRRSNLNITKALENNDYNEGDTFKFELVVNDVNGNDVWFSIVDKDENIIKDASVVGATKETKKLEYSELVTRIDVDEEAKIISYTYDKKDYVVDFAGYDSNHIPTYYTYYYYAPSGTKITVELEPTWNLRFINLHNGSTYTFTEIATLGYDFVSSLSEQDTITSRVNNADKKTYTVNGTIKEYNTSYLVKYTNKHVITDVEVIKVWVNDSESLRPIDGITVRLYADNVEKDVQVLKNPNWSYKWIGLNKYNKDGSLIVYTVSEDEVANYYTIIDGFTITNTYKYTTIKVDKNWDNTPESKRVNVIVKIKSVTDGYDYHDEATLGSSNGWSNTFNVLKYILNNNKLMPIVYGVEEVSIEGATLDNGLFIDYNNTIKAIIGKWTSVVSGDMDNGFIIKNTYKEMPTRVISLKKVSFKEDYLEGAVFGLYRYIGNGQSDGVTDIDLSNLGANWLFMQEAVSDGNGNFIFDGMYDDDGNLVIAGLYEGEYRLIETHAPDKYILPKGQWIVLLDLDANEENLDVLLGGSTNPQETPALLKLDNGTIKVYNEEIIDIPSTGGRGMFNNKYGLFFMLLGIGIYLYNVIKLRNKIENN